MLKPSLTATVAVAAMVFWATDPAHAQSRDEIRIVGSSTVFPFVTAVAEEFGRTTDFPTPIVEPLGTGGGLKDFCQGVGAQYPDLTNASRRIKASEVALCAKNGVEDIVEIKLGYDGIVLASDKSAPDLELTLRQLYLALAKQVPAPGSDGADLVDNPYKRWSDIDPDLPNLEIEVLGPPPTSGTRDAFNELGIEGGCKTFPAMKVLKKADPSRFKRVCRAIREDGRYKEMGENDNLIVQKLQANENAVGVFGFSFLDSNTDKIKGAALVPGDGPVAFEPTFDNIADGEYPLSRSLYVYVKKAHVGAIPGIDAFLQELTSEKAWGDFGYLAEKGLIPMPQSERQRYRQNVEDLIPLEMDS